MNSLSGQWGSLDPAAMQTESFAAGWWQHRTLGAVVAEYARDRPDDIAYRWDGHSMTWSEYDRLADAFAARLAGVGIGHDDKVLVVCPDGGMVHAAYVGVERAGAITVGAGWRAGTRELASIAGRTLPRAAILPAELRAGSAQSLCDELGIATLITIDDVDATADSSGISSGGPTAEPTAGIDPSELSMINSTSGTTGLPKCVMQTQNRWFYFHDKAVEFGRLGDDEVWMSVVPAPFGFGLWTSHFSPTLLGAHCIVQSRFDARRAAEAIAEHKVTVLCAVSSQFVMIHEQADDLDLSSLRVLYTGGERLPIERARAFEERTGCAVLNFYGSNETGLLSGTHVGDPLEVRVSSGGRCVDEMQVRLYDENLQRIDGDVGTGRPACKGPATSPGYYGDAAANAELFTDDGWMLMGDIVTIDESGLLTVVGRSADFIVRGGKNISAPAVEEEVLTHPSVSFAAALAVPDDRLGERVGICIQLKAGQTLDLDGLKVHLDARGVSKEWWPEHFAIVDELPTSSGGKIAKGELRTQVSTLFTSTTSTSTSSPDHSLDTSEKATPSA